MQKPIEGQRMGCNDQGAPIKYTEEQLSRLADALYYVSLVGLDRMAVWAMVPVDMKGEYIYSNWGYHGE